MSKASVPQDQRGEHHLAVNPARLPPPHMGRVDRGARSPDARDDTPDTLTGSGGDRSAGAQIVVRWIDAYNARDLDAMLACLREDVDYHPLRLGGLAGPYRGHDGVRRWFTQLDAPRHRHRIDLSGMHELGDDHLLAAGAVHVGDDGDVAPFSAEYTTMRGMIATARHYLSEPDLLQRLESPPRSSIQSILHTRDARPDVHPAS